MLYERSPFQEICLIARSSVRRTSFRLRNRMRRRNFTFARACDRGTKVERIFLSGPLVSGLPKIVARSLRATQCAPRRCRSSSRVVRATSNASYRRREERRRYPRRLIASNRFDWAIDSKRRRFGSERSATIAPICFGASSIKDTSA